nr:3-deoxy-7-phosphoheptulonate synthase [Halieaceae bacterium]OUT65423.1 MAG: 3-deoxy-7-phosphoheptulonate synthase [Cellvibrionales bacterium TMED21]|tara:strand:- start:8782 stop:9828 length:1047 start_codon:yes stop_codon:yes gene_type:complete
MTHPAFSAIDDVRIKQIESLATPDALIARHPVPAPVIEQITQTRAAISDILHGRDRRLLVVIGPCSIHDSKAALEYAERLVALREQHHESLEIVMRTYFEKPRTTLGWKGFINDPFLDNSCKINDGLAMARKLLLEINAMGMPTAGEFLDAISPQYVADLMAWGAIGARTTESQNHRQLASGMSCPIGFKNGTEGNIQIAVDAIRAAQAEHNFLSVTKTGEAAIVRTLGNQDTHLILRGGLRPNFDNASVREAELLLENASLPAKLMIDCSHANSQKDHARQIGVCHDLINQRRDGNQSIVGVMIESHLVGGKQAIGAPDALVYGQSITDACLGWDDSVMLLNDLATG